MLLLLILSLFCLTANAQQYCGPGQTLFASKCIQFMHVNLNFNAAETICTASNGHLVSIPNSIVNRYVATQAQQYTNGDFWIGAKTLSVNVADPLNWYWTDGSSYTYQNYEPRQPVSRGSNTCLQMRAGTGLWVAQNCDDLTSPFACEFPPQVAPTCPTPVVPSHCPSGYAWFDETDSCYRENVEKSTFNDAQSACQAEGAELVSIHSQSENDFLIQFTKHGLNQTSRLGDQVWTGFVYLNSTWQWTDGSPVDFIYWGPGQPDIMATDWWTELVSDVPADKGLYTKWNNVGHQYDRAFVCKIAALH